MSLDPQTLDLIPEETQRVAEAAFPKGNRYMSMRDELGTFYHDEDFIDLFPDSGQHAYSPWKLALITVMQFAEDLSDRQAAEAVRARIDWKYALSLELTDAGFDHSVLSEFRDRLLAGSAEALLLDRMLDAFRERQLLDERGKQRTDSTHILAAVRNLNRLEIVGETLHHALNVLAQVAPQWLTDQITPEWFDRYGQRFSDYRLPKEKQERTQLAETIGRDGHHLLDQIYAESAPPYLRTIPVIETLRQVWIQHYYVDEEGQCRWREQKSLPPSSLMIASPYDLESRYSQKRSTEWRGYKVHLTETCEIDSPNLITHVQTTLATDQDVSQLPRIHEGLEAKELLPSEHFVDGGYVSADHLVASEADYEVELVGPVRGENSWQAREAGAYAQSHFRIDWEAEQVTCPTGHVSRSWKSGTGPRGKARIQVGFDKQTCAVCSVRQHCTRSAQSARGLTLHPYAQQQALERAREYQHTQEFQERYATRAGVEGTVSQSVFAFGMRRSRYRGLGKTHLQHLATAAAINLQRVVDWSCGKPRSKTRVSHFAAMADAA